jgi:hypothetical protein
VGSEFSTCGCLCVVAMWEGWMIVMMTTCVRWNGSIFFPPLGPSNTSGNKQLLVHYRKPSLATSSPGHIEYI